MIVNKRTKNPLPPTLPDGSLVFCGGGETRQVSFPGLENSFEDCFFYGRWRWTLSQNDWSIDGGGNVKSALDLLSISLKSPNKTLLPGYDGNYGIWIRGVNNPSPFVQEPIWIGKAAFQSGNLTGPSTLYVGSNGLYTAPQADGEASYEWAFPNGGLRVVAGQGTTQARLEATGSTGLKVVELRAHNACGYNKKYIYINVQSSSGGGGGGGSDPCANTLTLSPNPTSGNMAALVLPPGGGGGDPCNQAAFSTRDGNIPRTNSTSFLNGVKDGHIIIVSYLGEEVYNKKHRGKEINLELNRLDAGVYTMYYYYNDSELLTTKFIKE